jgi:hypothetical protein
MEKKDNGSRNILISAIVLIILQGANLVGVAVNRTDIRHNAELAKESFRKVDMVYNDYVPMWFMEGLQRSTNYQTEEIIATIKGDMSKVKEINNKYMEFQRMMLNNLAQMRGGYSTTTRSLKPPNPE